MNEPLGEPDDTIREWEKLVGYARCWSRIVPKDETDLRAIEPLVLAGTVLQLMRGRDTIDKLLGKIFSIYPEWVEELAEIEAAEAIKAATAVPDPGYDRRAVP